MIWKCISYGAGVPAPAIRGESNSRAATSAFRIAGICAAAFLLAVCLPDLASAQRVKLDYFTVGDRGVDLLDDMDDALDDQCITKQELDAFAERVTRWSDQFDSLVLHDDSLTKKVVGYEDPPGADATEPPKNFWEPGYKPPAPVFVHGKPITRFDELRKLKGNLLNDLDLLKIKYQACHPSVGYLDGGYLGGELAKNSGRVRSIESLAATDRITNQFIDRGDPLGIGIVAGYNFRPWNNSVLIGPFASFDYLRQTINHNFAGGQFLGSATNWFINAGFKAGVMTAPGIYLYGLAGAAFLNHDLNVNFATAASSNVTTPGVTAGFGGEYRPPSWQLSGHPVSLFAQYQHTWWNDASFNRPASSPAFNYAFQRQDDTVKFGVNFYFGSGPAPASAPPAFPVKALISK